MTERELTPAEEEQVRRLLAAARHDEALPDDVGARLDRVLGDLQAERSEAVELGAERSEAAEIQASRAERAAGDELERRRTRRRWGLGLLAAAASVVVALTVPQVLSDGGMDSMSGDAGSDGGFADAEQNGDAAGGRSAPEARASRSTDPRLRRRVREALAAHAAGTSGDEVPLACPRRPSWGPGEAVAFAFEGDDAVLLARPVRDGARRVDVFGCATGDLATWVVVPAG